MIQVKYHLLATVDTSFRFMASIKGSVIQQLEISQDVYLNNLNSHITDIMKSVIIEEFGLDPSSEIELIDVTKQYCEMMATQ